MNTTTLIPNGPDFRGYWLDPRESSWSRFLCPGGQTATVVGKNYQACCPISPGEACTIATQCKDNMLCQSVLGQPSTTSILATPCGHQKCLDHVIFRENQGTNAGWDIIDEFACDEYGLGDDFGTLPWYRTVTALLSSHATPVPETITTTTDAHGTTHTSTLISLYTPYALLTRPNQTKYTKPRATVTSITNTTFVSISNGKPALINQTKGGDQLTATAFSTTTLTPVTFSTTTVIVSPVQLSLSVTPTTTPIVSATQLSSPATPTTSYPSSSSSFPIETSTANLALTATPSPSLASPVTISIQSAAANTSMPTEKGDIMSKKENMGLGIEIALGLTCVIAIIVITIWRWRKGAGARRTEIEG